MFSTRLLVSVFFFGSMVVLASSLCLNQNNEPMNDGDTYVMNDDPCTSCICQQGTLACMSDMCYLKPCPPGTKPIRIPTKCCERTCEQTRGFKAKLAKKINAMQ
ncbi:hypothetical protein MAR_019880 [Mya arenaria]|uniref:VWFC domain-containing protein n=1 Tax=Mya arenaria TaxID=6604 RepID=A0ABY7EBI0_MYAAR|nr:hypothetical protein MAR_019880 [Mya arenaria]